MADRAGSGAVGAEPPRAPAARRMARGERGRPVEESRWPRRNADSRREVGDLGAVAKLGRERRARESRRPGARSPASTSTRPLRNGRRESVPADAACRFFGAGPGSGSGLERAPGAAVAAGIGAGQARRPVRGRATPPPIVERPRREDAFEDRDRGFPGRRVIGDRRGLPAAPPPPRGFERRRSGKGTHDGRGAGNAVFRAEPDRNPGGPRA